MEHVCLVTPLQALKGIWYTASKSKQWCRTLTSEGAFSRSLKVRFCSFTEGIFLIKQNITWQFQSILDILSRMLSSNYLPFKRKKEKRKKRGGPNAELCPTLDTKKS